MWQDEVDHRESEVEVQLIGVLATVRDGPAQILLVVRVQDFGDRRDREHRLPFPCCRAADSGR